LTSLTCAVPFKILETVLGETPALAATMLKVAFTALTGEIELVEVVMVEFGAN